MSDPPTRDELLGALRAHLQRDHIEHAAATLDRFDRHTQAHYWRPVWERLQALLDAWPDDELEVPVAFCEHQALKWPAFVRVEPQWLSPTSILGHDPRLRLLGQLRISSFAPEFATLALEHPDALPHLQELYLHGQHTPEQLDAILAAPLLSQITSLHLEHVTLTARHIDALLRAPLRERLQTLTSSHNKLSATMMRRLGSAPWPALRALTLERANLDEDAVEALLVSQNMPALDTLELPQNQLNRLPQAALELKLKRLNLAVNRGGAPLIKSLMSGAHLERLEHLNLSVTELGARGLKLLLKPKRLHTLRTLHLHGHTQNPLTPRGINLLLEHAPPRLEHLELSQSDITWPQVASLLSREVMPDLLSLGAAYCPNLELSNASPLTTLEPSTTLRAVNLGFCRARKPAAAAKLLPMLQWPKTLDTLALFGVELDAPMLDALCQHPHLLKTLRTLNLNGIPAQARPIETLAQRAMPAMERLGIGCHDHAATPAQLKTLTQAPWFSQLLHLSVTLEEEGRDAITPHLARHRIICWD